MDDSYVERVVYRLKNWSEIDVEAPLFSGEGYGPHLTALREGCRNGRCNN
jgi:hypothetical protein